MVSREVHSPKLPNKEKDCDRSQRDANTHFLNGLQHSVAETGIKMHQSTYQVLCILMESTGGLAQKDQLHKNNHVKVCLEFDNKLESNSFITWKMFCGQI